MHLEHEIAEQPHIIERLLAEQTAYVREIAALIRRYQPRFIYIAARGTSDHAALYAKYLIGIRLNMPVMLAIPSAHTLYGSHPNLSQSLVIGISQSGQAQDVLQIIQDANQAEALTLSFTNNIDSPLALESDHHLHIMAGEEKSIAATKTYTTTLTAIAMLVTELVGDTSDNLQKLPQAMHDTLDHAQLIKTWVERYRYAERMAIIGRGFNYCSAYEISLKIKELCYIPSEEYSEADFRHGPIAIIENGFPVVLIMPQGTTFSLMKRLLNTLNERGAETLVISEIPDLICTYSMRISDNVPEELTPIIAILPGQFLVMKLAQVKGYSLDRPRHLEKVTITR